MDELMRWAERKACMILVDRLPKKYAAQVKAYIAALEAENATLRKALREIVDHDTSSAYDIPAIVIDIARDALTEIDNR